MLDKGVTGVLLVGLLAVSFSGCLLPGDSEGKAFGSLEAPAWRPGYAWAYDVTDTYEYSYVDDGSPRTSTESDSSTVRLTVFNTTEPIGEEAVYFVRKEGSTEHPVFGGWGGSVLAISAQDLSLAARSHDEYYVYEEAVAVPAVAVEDNGSEASGDDAGGLEWLLQEAMRSESPTASPDSVVMAPRHPGMAPGCDPAASVTPVPADERLPVLEFPLVDDAEWSGRWLMEGIAFDYTAALKGSKQVSVPAGTFEAVHAVIDLRFNAAGSEYDAFDAFRGRLEHWYAPETGYLVRSVFTASAQDPYGEGEFAFQSVVELTDHSLEEGVAEPAPYVESGGPELVEWRSYTIVADSEFPINVAHGPVAVTFGLREGGEVHYDYGPRPVTTESVPSKVDIDHDTYRVVWSVYAAGLNWPVYHEGDTFVFNVTRGGMYSISAEIQPIRCGGPWLSGAWAEAAAYWEDTVSVEPGVGPGETLDVLSFPVEWGAVQGLLTIDYETGGSANPDRGEARVVDPSGHVQYVEYMTGGDPAQTLFYPGYPGEWTLQWDTGMVSAVDAVEMTLRVDYDYSGGYYY